MPVRNWKTVCGMLGLSITLSGCLTVDSTTTVLEDGRIIEHMVIQPKNSLLTVLSLSAQAADGAGRKFEAEPFLQELRTAGNACVAADWIFEETYASQGIPYSSVPVPTDFEFSGIAVGGCSIQMGPYDPRTLPPEYAEDMLGMRIELENGRHESYRMSWLSFEEMLDDTQVSASVDEAGLAASCSGELEPELCQRELRTLLLWIKSMEDEVPDEPRDILSGPGMLVGTAELLRVVLKDVSVTVRIPDTAAVNRVEGFAFPTFTSSQEWIWRGSLMEVITMHPGLSVHIRPTLP